MNTLSPRVAAWIAALLAAAVHAAPSPEVTDTDSARRAAGQRLAALPPGMPTGSVTVTDTDTARRAAGLAWMRARMHVVAPVVVTDTDSARRAAALR